MDLYVAAAIIITLTALISFVNERFLGLPNVIGVMLGALVLSFSLFLFAGSSEFHDGVVRLLEQIDFDQLLMKGMLSFLLFAGALHVNLGDLRDQTAAISTLAIAGVVFSTFAIGLATFYLLQLLGTPVPFLWALAFGALISPTDPIAVLGLLRQAGAPKKVETLIVGESLFNDGMGVVVFSVVATLLGGGHGDSQGASTGDSTLSAADIAILFTQEAAGGIVLGLLLGLVGYWMLKAVDNYSVEILITLAVVMGGYAVAGKLHTSGPLAMVVAGLFLGNHGRLFAMTEETRQHLDTFWELIDEILNGVLFVLIGMEVLILEFGRSHLLAAFLAIPLVLFARFLAVWGPIQVLRKRMGYDRFTIGLLTWGGLRGGISIALALSLPTGPERDLLLFMTYAVVAFSILVQGLTVGRLAKRASAASA
jgi:CPA1 family monovalent cation:H+ antiporter